MFEITLDTWNWLFSTLIQTYGFLLGLLAVFYTSFLESFKKEDDNEVTGHIKLSFVLIIFLIIVSTIFLAFGPQLLNFYVSFFFFVVLGVIYPAIVLILVSDTIWVVMKVRES